MNRLALALTSLLCFALVVEANPPAAKDTWTKVRSKHFLLVGNASERDIRKVAIRLEQFRDVFTRLFPKANFQTPVPTTVMVFKNDGSYKPFKPLYNGKPANVAGYFQPGEDVNYITLTPDTGAGEPFRIIFHEYVHLLVNNNIQGAPAWFNEGLAEYYSTFDMEQDRKAQLGRVISNHVLLLRERFIPLRALLYVDHNSPLYNEREKQSIFYAESWALMHYLILGNEGKRLPQLPQVLTKLASGVAAEDAFQQAFQVDVETLEKELKAYVKRNTYPAQSATFKEKLEFDTEMQSAPVSEAEAVAYLGDLLYHINRSDDAVPHLEQSIALDPNIGMAHASLGMVRMRQKRYPEAKKHLEQAIAATSDNHLAHYYYAVALSREGMTERDLVQTYSAENAVRMRAALRKAIQLKPDFPESYKLLAFINLVTDEQLDESIELLKRARALAPGREDYSFILAQIYLRKEKFASARAVLRPIIQNSADPQLRVQAQAIMTQVDLMERQLADFKAQRDAMNSDQESDATRGTPTLRAASPTEQPMDEAALRLAAKRAEQEALKAALRKPADGEQRISGTLMRIDCTPKGIVYTVKVGEREVRLRSDNFDQVFFNTFVADGENEVACNRRIKPSATVIIYRPSRNAGAKTDGEAVAIEFVPQDFEFGK